VSEALFVVMYRSRTLLSCSCSRNCVRLCQLVCHDLSLQHTGIPVRSISRRMAVGSIASVISLSDVNNLFLVQIFPTKNEAVFLTALTLFASFIRVICSLGSYPTENQVLWGDCMGNNRFQI